MSLSATAALERTAPHVEAARAAAPANDAPPKLRWSWSGGKLRADNPTPYHVTFEAVEVLESGQRHARKTASSGRENMVLPGGRLRFELPTLKASANTEATVEFQTLDDYGVKAVHSAKAPP